MSFRQVRKPQAKKRVETMAIAPRSVLSGAPSWALEEASIWLRVVMGEPVLAEVT